MHVYVCIWYPVTVVSTKQIFVKQMDTSIFPKEIITAFQSLIRHLSLTVRCRAWWELLQMQWGLCTTPASRYPPCGEVSHKPRTYQRKEAMLPEEYAQASLKLPRRGYLCFTCSQRASQRKWHWRMSRSLMGERRQRFTLDRRNVPLRRRPRVHIRWNSLAPIFTFEKGINKSI